MELLYKTLRTILVTLVLLALVVTAVLYAVLSLPAVQDELARRGREELTALLGVPVYVERAEIVPFNKLTLHNVSIVVAPGDTAMRVDRLGGGVRIGKLLQGRIVFSYAEVIGLDLRISRDSAAAPLNIQPVLDHLRPANSDKPTTAFDLAIDNIVVRRSRVSYDVRSSAVAADGQIDYNHLDISDIKADIRLPRISNDCYRIDLRRLAAVERSGLTLTTLSGKALATDTLLAVDELNIELPTSRLEFAPLTIAYDSWDSLANLRFNQPFTFATLPGCHITPTDLSPLCPQLAWLNEPVDVDLVAEGNDGLLTVPYMALTATGMASVMVEDASVAGLPRIEELAVAVPTLRLRADGHSMAALCRGHSEVPERLVAMVDSLGTIDIAVDGALSPAATRLSVVADTDAGLADLIAHYDGSLASAGGALKASLTLDGIEAGALANLAQLGRVSATATFDGKVDAARRPTGHAVVGIDNVQWHGNDIANITAAIDLARTAVRMDFAADDPILQATATAAYGLTRDSIDLDLRINSFAPARVGLVNKEQLADHTLSGRVEVALHGDDYDSLDGKVELTEMRYAAPDGSNALTLDHLTLMSSGSTSPRFYMLHSDIADGQLQGQWHTADVLPAMRAIVADVFPSLVGKPAANDANDRPALDMALDMQLRQNATTDNWLAYFGVPLRLLRPISIKATINGNDRLIEASIDAPNLFNNNKFVDNTTLGLVIDGEANDARLSASTVYPTKSGPATVSLVAGGGSDSINVRADWDIERERTFCGAVELGAAFSRLPAATTPGAMATAIEVLPSNIVINDTIWRVRPALIEVAADRRIEVHDFEAARSEQFIKVDGIVSDSPADSICVELHNIDLDYVFGTLNIGAAMFGGVASGKLYASSLFSKEPRLEIPRLDVADMTYQQSPFGNTVITSYWDNASRGIAIQADITGPADNHSYVDGAIYPMADSLDFRFRADRLDVGFMRHYMDAFTTEVSGRASGEARLYGTFKYLDMTGHILADDLRLKLDYTNTYYHASDSIHLTPGRISFSDVVLTDDFGNSAQLNGWVTHKFFKKPEFEFRVSNARQLLCYDITDRINPDWYGQIYCDGSAFIKGVPGYIDINVNMSTAPGSTFTFVLSDTEAASEYTFLAFHDREERRSDLLLSIVDPSEAALRQLKEQIRKEQIQESGSSVYRINLQVGVNPMAEMILVMDPVGGDRIRARGNGNLRMEYSSSDEILHMFGTYALTQGSYNFTLQDIIIKDFTIKEGSSISFHGDPYAAELDINAIYSVNANLSDLDESFLQDKDLNRTNVPVHALLMVSGQMLQPDISFDLEFPTLTQDTYRKVRSIVSTDDMMNRQIIYLLALNRFYTPDYMASTTKGNELVSMASSTISSQLGSILGQLSDKWNIAPQFRSDRGDFSDMEVDLALSSYLLDNRLLFNGNFGYRDKALNNNSFIGDFDLEYLLNKSGNVRLKAYNRYNDQNYYVKTALTTQGVGIVFKRDFDDIFSMFKRWRRKSAEAKKSELSDR